MSAEERVADVFARTGCRGWLHAATLAGDDEVAVGADESVTPASTIKVLVAIEAAARFEDGRLDPAQPVRLGPEQRTVGPVGLWPVVASQTSALVLGGSVILLRRPVPWPRGGTVGWMAVAGPFDMTSNALFLLASRTGPLSVVAPLASLYPVSTVILALVVDRERLRAVQMIGLIMAVAALLLVSV